MEPDIVIKWDVELPATSQYPDIKRLQRLWVALDDERVGGTIVSTTGFTEVVLKLDYDNWRAAVRQAVHNTVRRTSPSLVFADDPGPQNYFAYTEAGTWVHRPLPSPVGGIS
jgi:hypothetical protein